MVMHAYQRRRGPRTLAILVSLSLLLTLAPAAQAQSLAGGLAEETQTLVTGTGTIVGAVLTHPVQIAAACVAVPVLLVVWMATELASPPPRSTPRDVTTRTPQRKTNHRRFP